jgi:hypothetical protein
VNIEDPRPRYGRMEKILAYGEAEAIYDHQNNQQRQAKIEILTQSAARRDSHGSRAGLTYVRLLCSGDHNLHAMLPQETVEPICLHREVRIGSSLHGPTISRLRSIFISLRRPEQRVQLISSMERVTGSSGSSWTRS